MNILVTGAKGFVGRNLVESLKNIRDGKDRVHSSLVQGDPLVIYEYDVDSSLADLEKYCKDCDFVFHLAGVNRPQNASEYMEGNFGFSQILLDTLKAYHNTCPVMLSSSVQATLEGRFADSEYGKSKLAGEELFFGDAKETGAKVLVYRFPNLFGKWCRPNYNSAIATFCHNIANELPICVNDRNTSLDVVYIDDLVEELLAAIIGEEHVADSEDDGRSFCSVPISYQVTLGEIVDLLHDFHEEPRTHLMPEIPEGSFAKKLFSTYLSYLPGEKTKVVLPMNVDDRGSFTEVMKTITGGQVSVNVNKPGVTKGEHWHHSKWEIFVVVSGHGLIQERKLGTEEIIEHEVSGERLEAVYLLPGYTHNLINLSDTEDLVTLIWANEEFDVNRPDTYREHVCNDSGVKK